MRAALLIVGHLRDACDDWSHLVRQKAECDRSIGACDVFLCSWNTTEIQTKTYHEVDASKAYVNLDAFGCAARIGRQVGATTMYVDSQLEKRPDEWDRSVINWMGVAYSVDAIDQCASIAARHDDLDSKYDFMFRIRPEPKYSGEIRFDRRPVDKHEILTAAPVHSDNINVDNTFWGSFRGMQCLIRTWSRILSNLTCPYHPEHAMIAASREAKLVLRRAADGAVVRQPSCFLTEKRGAFRP